MFAVYQFLAEHWMLIALVLGDIACAYGGYLVEKEKQETHDWFWRRD